MASNDFSTKPVHAVCIPSPFQSHISAMLKLAKLLHHRGCHITFVNSEFNHRRLLDAHGPSFLTDLPNRFRFVTIPDGFPPSRANNTQNVATMSDSCRLNMVGPFQALIGKLNERAAPPAASAGSEDFPAVSCIVADGFMTFSACPAGEKFDIPIINLWTIPACVLMAVIHYPTLKQKGLIPVKDEARFGNGSLEPTIDCIPGTRNLRPRDIPGFSKVMDPQGILLDMLVDVAARFNKAAATIVHTFEALESEVMSALSGMFTGPAYAIGPFQLLVDKIPENENNRLKNISGNLWKEDLECVRWLDSQKPGSVLYINFGSVAFLTTQQLVEFAMGIASSKHPFLWIIRADLVKGDREIPLEFGEETKDRSFICEWCPQEEVLNHPSIGGFLTHCGWNSAIESLSAGVPMLCWPYFGDQPTICRYLCTDWKVGLEIGSDVNRDKVERLVKELMEGESGQKMKEKAMEWKRLAFEATSQQGLSTANLDKLVREIILPK